MAAVIANVILSPFRKVNKSFKREKPPPLACHVALDQDENHVHTAACFHSVAPLGIAELYQAQGCVSCPPALPGILDSAAQDPNLVLLTFNVTYFDHLHKDTYASPRWDQRQKTYVRKWGRDSLFTPMVIVNGVADGGSAGGSKEEIDGVVAKARDVAEKNIDWHIYVDANDTSVRIDSDKLETEFPYEVVVITYQDKEELVKVAKGPNKGKKVPHRNVVRDITKIGDWTGGDIVLPLPAPREVTQKKKKADSTAQLVLVQAPLGGHVVAVCQVF